MNRRGAVEDRGFTLIEVLIATAVLVVVASAMGPVFYGAMRLTGMTNQRSQATNLAVAATEQMRSLPYSEVGFYTTPIGCNNNSETPVTLSSPGPLDALPTSTVVGHTAYTITRCVYWSSSSMPGTNQAYKQTSAIVSWSTAAGRLSVSQTSALFPGESVPATPSTTTTTTPQLLLLAPTCGVTGTTSSTIGLSISEPTGGLTPSFYLVYYSSYAPSGAITSGSNPYTTVQTTGDTTLNAGSGTTYYIQVSAVASDGTTSAPSSTCTANTPQPNGTSTTTTSTTYSSAASANALNLNLAGSTVPYGLTTTSASNNGSGSNAQVANQPSVSIPGADSFLKVTLASQIAEANTDGSSYACAGVLSSGDSLSGCSYSSSCAISGSGTGGVYLNLMGLPGVASAINTIVSGLTLSLNGAASCATGTPGGTSLTGSAVLSGASVTVTNLAGLVSVTVPLSLPATLTSPTDLVQAITTAIGTSSLSSLAAPLQTALPSALTLTGRYENTSGGVYSISALHMVVLSGAGTADLAMSSVGPNSKSTTSSTTYTPPPCQVYSLVVYPSAGPSGGGVALTTKGNLANESSFQVSVNQSGTCSGVEVGYAPSGCVPGSSGCITSYATLSGSGGTLYGSAGTASTTWTVGTTTFTVFTGSPPTVYQPLAQQQVMLCTENGTTGKC